MKTLKVSVLIIALIAAIAGSAAAQDQNRRWRNEPERNVRGRAYRAGLRDGRQAARVSVVPRAVPVKKQGKVARSYATGFHQGYRAASNPPRRRTSGAAYRQNGGVYGRGPGNGPYGRGPGSGPYGRDTGSGPYGRGQVDDRYGRGPGNQPASGMQQARNIGYEEGLSDGIHDRLTGHSFRPTQGDHYKNADRGYSSSFGNKDQYKQLYREGYMQGYQAGYNRGR